MKGLSPCWSVSGPAVPPVRRQQRGGAAERPGGLSDQQPRAAADRAAVRECPEPAGTRGERRPAVLFGLHTEHAGGAAHYQHTAGGKEEVGFSRCVCLCTDFSSHHL